MRNIFEGIYFCDWFAAVHSEGTLIVQLKNKCDVVNFSSLENKIHRRWSSSASCTYPYFQKKNSVFRIERYKTAIFWHNHK